LLNKNFIKNIPYFSSLDDELIKKLVNISRLKKFASGDVLFYEQDGQNEIFYLYKGSIKFYKVDKYDNEIFLYKILSNSIVFDISKFCDAHIFSSYTNAEFLEDSEVLVFDNIEFKKLMYDNNSLMSLVLNESFKMIQRLQCVISRDIIFDSTAKVANMLVNDLKSFNNSKKHEIAYMLNIQPETLSRILRKLAKNGIIKTEKNNVKILNLKKLKETYQ